MFEIFLEVGEGLGSFRAPSALPVAGRGSVPLPLEGAR